MSTIIHPFFVAAAILLLLLCSAQSFAQDQLPAPLPADTSTAAQTVQLTLQGEVPLSDFIDYVSERLSLQILYDESIRERSINLIAPDPIPLSSLPQLLQSVLVNEGLVVTDTDKQGFKRITTSNQIPLVARPSQPNEDLSTIDAAIPITRVFVLEEAKPSSLPELIKPFLSGQGASTIPLDRNGILIVTDIARNIRRVESLVRTLDAAQAQVEIEFIQAQNVAVDLLAEQLAGILDAKRRATGTVDESMPGVEVAIESRTNSVILVGTKSEILQAAKLLERLDKNLETERETYSLQYYSPERLDELIRTRISERPIKPPYQARVEGNSLIVDSTPDVLLLIRRSIQELDTREAPDEQSPIRFYKIKNVPAQQLVETVRGIGGNVRINADRPSVEPRRRTTNDEAVPGKNFPPIISPGAAQPIREPITPPAMRPDTPTSTARDVPQGDLEFAQENGFRPGFPDEFVTEPSYGNPSNLIGDADVTVDIHTNTIIVVAAPEVQRIYAKLIETLDVRRPQVLIEAKIVIIDTSDDYTLGVEVSGGDRTGARRLFSFSSYGLSTVNPTDGALSILPGIGFNGTLVDPSTADVVVRALANHRRARVLSTPRLLVNDNAEGQLTSVLEVPFTSVNASQTVATTSFAGFAEAGTTITATPTISDDNYLQVDYVVTLNSFTGTGTEGVPPPRQTNEIQSSVTVPDGYTIIVGGLTSKNQSYEIDTIPWLERIPVVRDLASLQQNSSNQTSLFVFLKPVILREDKFKDLRYLSDVDLRRSSSSTNFPTNPPLLLDCTSGQ
ncbi:secretin N-terminal domain-containing protein [Roseiconus lacunae]|uniref:secretin N-terminal domain-containing protein n=1 Tax=Roseiconus lacunae TaxID=2605694 RepID=UPI003093941B|nr:secretin N-terminal domain-containing protein [Stieleria sp. HD01]